VIGATITAATSANGVLLSSRFRRSRDGTDDYIYIPYKYRLPRYPALLRLADRSPTKYLYLAPSPRSLGYLVDRTPRGDLSACSPRDQRASVAEVRNGSATSVTSGRGQRTGAIGGDRRRYRVPRFPPIRNGAISSVPRNSLVIRGANGGMRAYARPSISRAALNRPPFDNYRVDRLSNRPSSRVMAGSRAFGAASASTITGRGQGRGDRERRSREA